MKRKNAFIVLTLILGCLTTLSAQQEESSNVCTTPVGRANFSAAQAGWVGDISWMKQHQDICKLAETKHPQLVFIGDSITQSWGGPGRKVWKPAKKVWRKEYRQYKALNFGISGDRTEHILWRLQNGNLGQINPKAIVLLIGTNNIADNSSAEIIKGITAITQLINRELPDCKLLLMAVFPRNELDHPYRQKVNEINAGIQSLHNGASIHYLDIGSEFLTKEGAINHQFIGGDKLHLTPAGYQVWADSIRKPLQSFLN